MKLLYSFLLLLTFHLDKKTKLTVTQKGWLVYRHSDMLAFLPIKDQNKTPSYDNFLTEEKGDGQRMNNYSSAPPKLLIAKIFMLDIYHYDPALKIDTLAGKARFYIQPVTYIYEVERPEIDTADFLAGGWTFPIKGRPIFHPVYYFNERSGEIRFLNKKDSLFAAQGGRRRSIEIYPPH